MWNELVNFVFIFSLFNLIIIKADDDKSNINEIDHFTSCEPTKDKVIDPWIYKMVEEKKYFESNVEIVDLQIPDSPKISLIDEIYDFGNETGEIRFMHHFSIQESIIEYAKYFDDLVYLSSNNTSKCDKKTRDDKEVLNRFMLRWLPEDVYEDGSSSYNKVLGPLSLLLHLKDKMITSVHKYEFVDKDLIQNFGYNFCIQDRFMIRYFQVFDATSQQNSIKTIQILERNDQNDEQSKNEDEDDENEQNEENEVDEQNEKNEVNEQKKDELKQDQESKWILKTQFNYFYSTIRADVHLEDHLPIGIGCLRECSDFKRPKFENQRFELDFQFIQNQAHNYIDRPNINHFDYRFTIIQHHKLYFDYVQNLAANFKEDPSANLTKQIHDYSINITYDIDIAKGTCQKIQQPKGEGSITIDFSDPLSIINNLPEVLTMGKTNSYIGTFITRNIKCEVYEAIFYRMVDNRNESFIVTHYYALDGFDISSSKKIPIRIDLKQFSNDNFDSQLGYYVFMINKFYPALDFGKQEIFDISCCLPHYYQYNWFLIEFHTDLDEIRKLKNAQLALIDGFKKELAISSLRLPKILVDFDDSTVYFTTKLLEVPAIKQHFELNSQKKLINPHVNYLSDHEENCAKNCFSQPDCVAFSYCSDMQCAQLMFEDYSDDKTILPKNYIKSEENENCNLHKRKFKLKRDDISSRDIRSVMSNLNKKVNSGKFSFDVKVGKEEDEKINLRASEIVLNVEPGSRQSNYLDDDERQLEHGTSANYDQYFSVYMPNYSLDYKKLKEQKMELIDRHSQSKLADCELQCINNLQCHSFSYCDNNICILTSAFDDKTINENMNPQLKCFISKKNYLSSYAIHESPKIKNIARKVLILESVELQNPEQCAKSCSSLNETDKYECLSFEYCDAKKRNSDQSEKVCLFHGLDLKNEHEQKLDWDYEKTHCTHYTKKHSTDYKEYSMQKMIKNDLIEHTKISMEKCASICDEHELCNSFDYCFDPDEHGVHNNQNIRCRLHSDTYNIKNVKLNNPKCSIYETIRPKIPLKKTIRRKRTYSKGLTVFLSFVALISGSSIGVLLAFLVIRKYLRDDEHEL